jgi:hypothetical protein
MVTAFQESYLSCAMFSHRPIARLNRRARVGACVGVATLAAFVVAYAANAQEEARRREFDRNTQAVDVIDKPATMPLRLSRRIKAVLEAAIVQPPDRKPPRPWVRLVVAVERKKGSAPTLGAVFLNLPKKPEKPLDSKNSHFMGSFSFSHPKESRDGEAEEFYLEVVGTLRKLRKSGERKIPDVLQLTFVPKPLRPSQTQAQLGFRVVAARLSVVTEEPGPAANGSARPGSGA